MGAGEGQKLIAGHIECRGRPNGQAFFGCCHCSWRRANPTDPKVFEVIDGQQRLTTAFLFIAALAKVLSQRQHEKEAAQLLQNFLQIGRDYRNSNLRIHSSRLDRTMMNAVIDDLKASEKLMDELRPYTLNALPSYGSNRGPMRNNYNRFKRFFNDEFEQGELDRVRSIYESFLNNFTVVQIDVLDPTDGPKIFDSLNSQQEPMRISDLVRNEIFRKVSDEAPEKIERLDEEIWQPFYASFEKSGNNHFDKYLFPFALITDPNLKKSDVFINLRNQWNSQDDPSVIIQSLDFYKKPYLDTLFGENSSGFGSGLATSFKRLSDLGAPSSILPFTMRLGRAALDGEVSEDEASKMLDVIESFLVKRAIVGYEPTGLHAVFKRLWLDLESDLTAANVSAVISSHKTVSWPTAEDVSEAIATRPLYGSAITPYLLLEYDHFHGGDTIDKVETIEHVLPQSAGLDWKRIYGEDFVSADKDTLPNLLPCTGKMNSSLGNQPYEKKKERFSKDSKFKSTRMFAEIFDEWDREGFQKRAAEISAWAISRWPHERVSLID